jgi:hypothetical protein
MGLFESFTHTEEIERLTDSAQSMYSSAKSRFETQKIDTTKKLEHLGKIKVQAWSTSMDSFVSVFGEFKNVSMDKNIDFNLDFFGSDEEPQHMMINIQNFSMTASEVAKAGFTAVGTGALVGIASYGGVMMLGVASDGTAISSLSGIAKSDAVLDWFGGGSLEEGGLGKAGGQLVLVGIVLAPIFIIGTMIASAKGKERLAEAKRVYAEAKDASEKIEIVTTGMIGIAKMSENYSAFIKMFDKKFKLFIVALRKISKKHSTKNDEKIDFNKLSIAEQKVVHLSWLMAQIYYHALSATILTAEGNVSSEAESVIKAVNNDFTEIKNVTYKMTGDDVEAANILWNPYAKRMFIVNFLVGLYLFGFGINHSSSNFLMGFLIVLDSFIVFPSFIKFKKPVASKLYTNRIIRLIIASVICVLLLIWS